MRLEIDIPESLVDYFLVYSLVERIRGGANREMNPIEEVCKIVTDAIGAYEQKVLEEREMNNAI